MHSRFNESCVCVKPIRGLQKEEVVLLTHGDSVDKVADGFKVVAQSGNIIAGEQDTRNASILLNIIHKYIMVNYKSSFIWTLC